MAALKLKADPTFRAKVAISAPGGLLEVEFTFRHKTRDELHGYLFGDHPERTDVDAVLEIAETWHDVDAEFGRAALEELFQNYHAAARDIIRGYAEELTQARVKN